MRGHERGEESRRISKCDHTQKVRESVGREFRCGLIKPKWRIELKEHRRRPMKCLAHSWGWVIPFTGPISSGPATFEMHSMLHMLDETD